jgi:molybdate/tungstate transport system substrate-binding protein
VFSSPRSRRALLAVLCPLLAACGSSSGDRRLEGIPAASGRGSVSVLYAASLEQLMNTRVAPAFRRATGYTFTGYPGGSKELASEIRGGIRQGDVFISASPRVDAELERPASGGWVSWYAPFATTRLVLGYNPHSSFAAALRRGPWYRVITRPGFRLGFTDPMLDPKGALAVAALERAAGLYHEPALARLAGDRSDLFPEEDLVGRLQAGQLDAGFFYTVEASAARIPTVSLAPIDERATYTITVLRPARERPGAIAFVRFLLSASGRTLMRSAGLAASARPRAVGDRVPAALAGVVGAG